MQDTGAKTDKQCLGVGALVGALVLLSPCFHQSQVQNQDFPLSPSWVASCYPSAVLNLLAYNSPPQAPISWCQPAQFQVEPSCHRQVLLSSQCPSLLAPQSCQGHTTSLQLVEFSLRPFTLSRFVLPLRDPLTQTPSTLNVLSGREPHLQLQVSVHC